MGAVSTKKKSNAGKNVLVFFLVFIILEMLIIFGISKVFKNKDVTPSVLGYSMFMTKEDLYKDSEAGIEVAVPKNVLVIASNGLPDPTNKIGTAVLCEKIPDVGTGVFYLADVSSVEGQDGAVYTISNGAKYYTVKSSNIVGVTGSYYKTAGTVISFVTKKFGMIVCAVVPLFLMILLELIIAIATHSSDDYDDEEDDEEEEEERKEVQLDDFLFGGQNEGGQIAKQRKQQSASGKKGNVKPNTVDFDDFAPPKKKVAPANKAQAQTAQAQRSAPVQQATQQTAPTQQAEQPAKQVETATARFDKPAAQTEQAQQVTQTQQAAPVQQAASAQQAEVQQTAQAETEEAAAAPKPRKRKRLSSATAVGESANASLEELMKLMEEEQNKLKNQMK